MSEIVLQTQAVEKRFGEKRVLNGVDWRVPRGSVNGLLGRNAAGKTTLLKLALGLLRADHGEIELLGEDPWKLSATTKARLGYVPQEYRPYPWMTAREVLDYTAAFYPQWDALLVDELLHDWELDSDTPTKELSVGQRQRLGLLAALGNIPELLILDEPAASLDPAARRAFLELVLQVVSEGERTVIFSTHILSDLERVADRVAILRDGRIVYDDDLDTLKDQVKRMRIMAASELPRDLGIPGLLHAKVRGREALISVICEDGSLAKDLERRFAAEVQVQELNLEDIFLEMSHE
jgi:ABC-2 type transport system ATP-binding protein